MKKIIKTICIVLLCLLTAAFVACGGNSGNVQGGGTQTEQGDSSDKPDTPNKPDTPDKPDTPNKPDTPELKKFDSVSFNDAVFTYDGTEKCLEVIGKLPDTAQVEYENEKAIDTGEYDAKAVISASGYETLILRAKLTINKAVMQGVSFTDGEFKYDGNSKNIFVNGAPFGAIVVYYCNGEKCDGFVDAGKYDITAVISHKNYSDLTLKATLTIERDISGLVGAAKEIVEKIISVPDAWKYLPNSFSIKERAAKYQPETDFSRGFVQTSVITRHGIGKQLNVMYNALAEFEGVVKYVKIVQGSVGAITSVYQKFINDNPDDYKSFDTSIDGTPKIDLGIRLNGEDYILLARIGTVALELNYNDQTKVRSGRVQLNESIAIKYELAENKTKIAVKALNAFATQIEFERKDEKTVGYVREFWGTESKNIKNSAVIYVEDKYTSVISNKRETDDLAIKGYVETYLNSTGELIAAEVQETVKAKDYDTYWFNLGDVSGVNSIKVIHEQNGMNMDKIFINGSSETIHTKIISITNPSRRFDIEMKDVYFYRYDTENEKYEKVKESIPMLFVQRDMKKDFGADFYDKNKNCGMTVKPEILVKNEEISWLNSAFDNLNSAFTELKRSVNYADIKEWIGLKNVFFS